MDKTRWLGRSCENQNKWKSNRKPASVTGFCGEHARPLFSPQKRIAYETNVNANDRTNKNKTKNPQRDRQHTNICLNEWLKRTVTVKCLMISTLINFEFRKLNQLECDCEWGEEKKGISTLTSKRATVIASKFNDWQFLLLLSLPWRLSLASFRKWVIYSGIQCRRSNVFFLYAPQDCQRMEIQHNENDSVENLLK